MMAALCGQKYKDGRTVTDWKVAHMLTALMAGQHTSSSSVAWTVMHMANSPAVAYVSPSSSRRSRFTVFSARLCMRNN